MDLNSLINKLKDLFSISIDKEINLDVDISDEKEQPIQNQTIIPDEQMARFRFMLDYSEEAICMNSAPLARGEKVRVVKGPLTGLVGELVTVDGRSKIAVRLNMLGCACADMPVGYVEKIENQVAV